MTRSCVVLLSGGLDSLLALRLMAIQGLRVVALHAENSFHGSEKAERVRERIGESARRLGAAEVVFPDLAQAVIEAVKHPRHGYGRNLNPCIDCRLLTVRSGFDVMTEMGLDFVASGEVVGQRPMSQRRDAIRLADRMVEDWGFKGLYLRPLSARALDKTTPELEGWIDPKYLYGIVGRSRTTQMMLAKEVGLDVYPSPAGGCLLTDAAFSRRLGGLMRATPDWGAGDVELLKVGRHFLPAPGVRIVASRREAENARLEELARPEDFLYINAERNGAIVMLRGDASPECDAIAAGLAVHFSKTRESGRAVVRRWRGGGEKNSIDRECRVMDPEAVRELEKRASLP
ncbi:MAG: tRNA 4-thiouridine(8) synthase ThiI [Planctomycetota bacterium]|jgi:hypothetical protein|nr:tRNA 4-thiouridine(8) synthase ThiI [Planctomycetota bacterium]